MVRKRALAVRALKEQQTQCPPRQPAPRHPAPEAAKDGGKPSTPKEGWRYLLTAVRTSDSVKEMPSKEAREEGESSEEQEQTPEERQPPRKKGRKSQVLDDDDLDLLFMESRAATNGKILC